MTREPRKPTARKLRMHGELERLFPRGSIELCGYAKTDTGSHIGGQPSLYRSSGWSDRSGLTGEIVW